MQTKAQPYKLSVSLGRTLLIIACIGNHRDRLHNHSRIRPHDDVRVGIFRKRLVNHLEALPKAIERLLHRTIR